MKLLLERSVTTAVRAQAEACGGGSSSCCLTTGLCIQTQNNPHVVFVAGQLCCGYMLLSRARSPSKRQHPVAPASVCHQMARLLSGRGVFRGLLRANGYCRQSRRHWRSRSLHHREPLRAKRAYKSRARCVRLMAFLALAGNLYAQQMLCSILSAWG